MCIYEDKSESYEAFKKIWKTHYRRYPDYQLAKTYSGGDRVKNWLKNVNELYNNLN